MLDALSMPVVERIPTCTPCHGADGNSRIENTPSLAGQPEFFLLNQLILFSTGRTQLDDTISEIQKLGSRVLKQNQPAGK